MVINIEERPFNSALDEQDPLSLHLVNESNDVTGGTFDLTTTGIIQAGNNFIASLGDEGNQWAGYFTDGTRSTYLADGSYCVNVTGGPSQFVGFNGDYVYLGYLGSGGAVYATDTSSNTVGLADGTYAINATGTILADGTTPAYMNYSGYGLYTNYDLYVGGGLLSTDLATSLVTITGNLTTTGTGQFASMGVGTAPVAGNALTVLGGATAYTGGIRINQGADNTGLIIYGYDDESTANFFIGHTGSGATSFVATDAFSMQSTTSYFAMTAKTDMYLTLGDASGANKVIIRDSGYATVATIDSNGGAIVTSLNAGSGAITTTGTLGAGAITGTGKLTVNQVADSQGIQINGYDDRSTKNLQLYIDSGGATELLANDTFRLIAPIFLMRSNSATGNLYYDLGDTLGVSKCIFRTSGFATVVSIDSLGMFTIFSDTAGLKLGADQDTLLYSDAAGVLYIKPTAADTDTTLNFFGTTNSGQFKWMEDEDYFQFADDINLGGATNYIQISDSTGQVSLGGTYKQKLSMRPTILSSKIVKTGSDYFIVPTQVDYQASSGYSLPLYSAGNDEELYFNEYIAGRWDGASDITCTIVGYLATAATANDNLKFQLSWNNKSTASGTMVASTTDVTTETTLPDARKAQYSIYKIEFTIDWDVNDPDIVASDAWYGRLRRVAASSAEYAGEFVVTHVIMTYTVNKMFKAA